MSNPLDVAHGFGTHDELFDLFEELWNKDDPCAVLIRCEENDLEEGWGLGTTFQLYLAHYYERKAP